MRLMIESVASGPKKHARPFLTAMEKREAARFTEQDAATRTAEKPKAYKSALRKVNYDF